MPFENLLLHTREGGPASRRAGLALAFLIHAVLICAGVVHSVWHVDEVLPPTVIIRIGPVSPAPAPADPPAASPTASKQPERARPVKKKEVAPTDVVAPQVPTGDSPTASITSDKGVDNGPNVDGKTGGGDPGVRTCVGDGCAPGPSSLPPAEHILPPTIGAKTCSYCPPPSLPLHLRSADQQRSLMVKICVASDGRVSKVKILQGIEPAADIAIVGALHRWRYDPPTVNGHPVPFCYATRFIFVAQ